MSALQHLFTNRSLWAAIGLSAILQIAVVHLAFMNDAFKTSPLDATGWLVSLALASLVLWADEAKKIITRRRAHRHARH